MKSLNTNKLSKNIIESKLRKMYVEMIAQSIDKDSNSYTGGKICLRWRLSFNNFYKDLIKNKLWNDKNILNFNIKLYRINPNKTYCKKNIKLFITRNTSIKKLKMNHWKVKHRITYNGVTKDCSEWAKTIGNGITSDCIYARFVRLGWSAERTLEQPMRIFKKK